MHAIPAASWVSHPYIRLSFLFTPGRGRIADTVITSSNDRGVKRLKYGSIIKVAVRAGSSVASYTNVNTGTDRTPW